MNKRRITVVLTAVLLLAAFGSMPAQAGITDFNGTVQFVGPWNDLVPLKETGVTIHEFADIGFSMLTDDPRVNGFYLFTCGLLYPQGVAWRGIHCKWVAYIDADEVPDWQGVMTITGSFVEDHWNVEGSGLGQYAGLKVNFKAPQGAPEGFGPVTGQVIGD